MQTLSPTISPTISKANKPKVNELDELLPAIAQSTVLKNTLSGLDASLNDELDRYRHWKENGQTISYLNPFRPRAVSTQSIWSSPSLSDTLSPLTPVTGESNVNESDRHTIQMPVMPSLNLESAELHRYQGMVNLDRPSNSLDSQIHSSEQVSVQRLDNKFAAYAPVDPHQNLQIPDQQLEGASINEPTLKSGFAADDDDEILQRFANDYAENYYEVAAPDLATNASPKGTIRSLMNPVGIISLLLLLCSSAAIGYLMVDPSGVMKLLKPEQSPKTSNQTKQDLGKDGSLQRQTGDSGSQSFIPFAEDKSQASSRVDPLTGKPTTNSAIAAKNPLTNPTTNPLTNPLGNSANSANPLGNTSDLFAPSSTFVPSQSLRTVPPTALPPISVAPLPPSNVAAPVDRSYSPPSRTYEPAPAPRSEPAPTPRRSTASSRPAAAPARTTVTVSPKPTTVRSAAIANPPAPRSNVSVKYAAPLSAAPAPSGNSSYRIVVENSYAASAQQVERDAFVRPSDGQVQMGSFRDQNTAQQRIEELRRQGIPARIE